MAEYYPINKKFYQKENQHKWCRSTLIEENSRPQKLHLHITMPGQQIDEAWPGLGYKVGAPRPRACHMPPPLLCCSRNKLPQVFPTCSFMLFHVSSPPFLKLEFLSQSSLLLSPNPAYPLAILGGPTHSSGHSRASLPPRSLFPGCLLPSLVPSTPRTQA